MELLKLVVVQLVHIYSSWYVQVIDGEVTVNLPVDHVMTLSTKTGQTKGEYTPPASAPFPVPYNDNFESQSLHVLT